jgi:hypothetical protein
MSDLWRWDWGYCGWGAICCLQWVCFPRLPALLRVRAKRRESGLPSVQDQIQTSQRWDQDQFCIPLFDFVVDILLYNLTNQWTAGSPRVEGDEEEDGIDDIDNEFDYDLDDFGQPIHPDSVFSGRLNTGRGSNTNISGANSEHGSPPLNSEIPLLTYGEEVYLWIPLLTCLIFTYLLHYLTPAAMLIPCITLFDLLYL